MKKLFTLLALFFTLNLGVSQTATAQDSTKTETVDSTAAAATPEVTTADVAPEAAPAEETTFHQTLKIKFIEGGWEFMGLVLLCLIIGMAVAIERIITLNLATTNVDKLLKRVEVALADGGVESATEVCKTSSGPVAAIFTQGLMRFDEGLDMVEKSIVGYGSVQMGRLEKGLVWISLFISMGPMLGFMGTVVGMIQAFDAIQQAGDISPTLVASGIKVALLTTVGGLVVAIVLQLFYNYCVSKIDGLVNDMEDASIRLIDLLVKHKETAK